MRGVPIGFRKVHIGALALVAIMLPWSEFLLSNAQFLLIGNWLVEGVVRKDLVGRFKRGFTDPSCLLFVSLFALHVLGLAWTEDLAWGLDLCRILLPVLAFAPILASVPRLQHGELRSIVLLGAWSTVASTLVCLLLREDVLADGGYREISVFISHIRLSLLLCFSVATFVVYWPGLWMMRMAHLAATLWSVYFLDLLSSLTGVLILCVLLLYAGWRIAQRLKTLIRWATRAALVLIPLSIVGYAQWCIEHYEADDRAMLAHLPEYSVGGEKYWHDLQEPQVENGHFVWINVAGEELRRGWTQRSSLPFEGKGHSGEQVKFTLVRYMASMGLTKDSVGLKQLSPEDVVRVERGIASVVQGRQDPLRARMNQVLFEYQDHRIGGEVDGHSVVMRYEFLRTGWSIAKAHWLFGVGTGDTRPAFAEAYEQQGSRLSQPYRLRAHDQYLTWLISFGIVGTVWCLISILLPASRNKAFRQPLFVCWAIIFFVSCLGEDTLETQMGASFFAFPYCLLVFAAPLNAAADPAPVAD